MHPSPVAQSSSVASTSLRHAANTNRERLRRTTSPAQLPADDLDALEYLGRALGHPCYERWTVLRLKEVYPTLQDAKAENPKLFRLLLDHPEVRST